MLGDSYLNLVINVNDMCDESGGWVVRGLREGYLSRKKKGFGKWLAVGILMV